MRARIVTAVVDTSPLLSALILEYMRRSSPVRSEKILSSSRIADYLQHDQKRRMNFVRLFESIPNILATSHVLGELQGLQRLKEDYQRGFWECAMQWLSAKGLDERLVKLLDLHGDTSLRRAVGEVGSTDAGLVSLARQVGCFTPDKVLLTDDQRTLAPLARQQQVYCYVVEDLLL